VENARHCCRFASCTTTAKRNVDPEWGRSPIGLRPLPWNSRHLVLNEGGHSRGVTMDGVLRRATTFGGRLEFGAGTSSNVRRRVPSPGAFQLEVADVVAVMWESSTREC